jgi:hypothetical protein
MVCCRLINYRIIYASADQTKCDPYANCQEGHCHIECVAEAIKENKVFVASKCMRETP